ncbi:threonine synthase [Aneurinibacillus thermoaerophilus]|uniref:Threonine synthase n=1 Tax=Aneurinibacillus thermoaerophilus TaxID=143495 RepID=A0A1G7Y9D5_ANETH|nr:MULTISPECIES: threonine synthase [Aneurinibacillus]AMA72139.1 threonine synthase [Aneurinibacillus sp. XH2]MED0676424.1 threonine synthase [Aneurinibacillus thermoaerophilus]MED0678936.1 threonine synthase [Aneurinibacillus thermoaerophilus]MED0755976.1 threonine synthase [Aneurinibacillus thermoaerophilus]MED0759700.1 threonine synthase [Aneurinibacillus thermoaerophilus]
MAGIIERYAKYLPVTEKTPRLTLHEGNTPLIFAPKLSQQLDLEIYFKYEGLNPTGSFKDRGMVMAVAKAVEEGSHTIMCASTGNTSAAAAAYAARANLRCIVLIPNNNIALGKLAQAMVYGAEIIAIEGNFDQALKIVRDITEKHPITLVNSVNPYRLEGQKTAAFEICDALGKAPDILAIPVGNAGNISAYWKGFKEYYEAGVVRNRPRMFGFEAEGAAALVKGEVIENPETLATAIRIGNPASWNLALNARDESGGHIDMVTDEEILDAYRKLAQTEGIFAEPASAASLAGIIKMRKLGRIEAGKQVVCVLTGNGLKDPNIALTSVGVEPIVVESTEEAVLGIIARGAGV